ncbi:tetratricopeptide repeat protein [Corynebacterium pacaense]|uniref:tetratricopeptide repeat protein n=1 Tax=Corynebacterium pacaense TaxID=1816684 RepID=UPI0009BBAE5F|nr:tetratricopeptide repeat protein [Corynebacterium pacaense]
MSTPQRFVSGAIDLGEVRARAEARQAPASGVAATVEVTMDNLEEEVLRRSTQVPVIVVVGTSRSPESEQLRRDFSDLAAKSARQFIFAYVDADTHPDVAQVFGVQVLPTTLAIAAGRPLANFEGGQPADAIAQWVGSVVQAVSGQLEGLAETEDEEEVGDPRFDAATEALNSGDFTAAIAAYDAILESEPRNAEARQARDTALLLSRLNSLDPAVDAIAAADADPEDLDKALAAADASVAAGDPEAAFDRLIGLLTGPDRDAAKARLIELFGMFEPSDPRVLSARGRLASALY